MGLKYEVHKKENIYFWSLAIISSFIYLSWIYHCISFITSGIVSPFLGLSLYIIFYTIVLYFLMQSDIGKIRGNAVKVSIKQFPDLFELVNKQSKQLGLKKIPSVYVMQEGGIISAFVIKQFIRKHHVILLAPILEEAYKDGKDTLAFILGHELGHIKQNHPGFWKDLFITPAKIVAYPLWLAYSRACEYTCDRIGYALSPTGAMKGIGLIALGSQLYSKLDIKDWILRAEEDSGFLSHIDEFFSIHPHLSKRMKVIYLINDNTEKEHFKKITL